MCGVFGHVYKWVCQIVAWIASATQRGSRCLLYRIYLSWSIDTPEREWSGVEVRMTEIMRWAAELQEILSYIASVTDQSTAGRRRNNCAVLWCRTHTHSNKFQKSLLHPENLDPKLINI